MPEQDDSIALLREIRDLLAQREQAYQGYLARHEKVRAEHYEKNQQANAQHLANMEKAWAAHAERIHRQNKEREHYLWFMLFVTTFGAVFAALLLSK